MWRRTPGGGVVFYECGSSHLCFTLDSCEPGYVINVDLGLLQVVEEPYGCLLCDVALMAYEL